MRFTHEDECVEGQPLISSVTLTTDPTPIPATPLFERNVLFIHNSSNVDIVLCNADGTGTFTIEPGDYIKFNTRDSNPLFYGKVAADTADIEIMEWK